MQVGAGPPFQRLLASELDVPVVALELHELEVGEPGPAFDADVAAAEADARAGRVGDPGRARALYRHFGVDPTRHRPSNEALLRRVCGNEASNSSNAIVGS